jgi:hypothetical protein
MGYSHLADFSLFWIAESNLAITHKKVAGRLLFGCGSYDLANRGVDRLRTPLNLNCFSYARHQRHKQRHAQLS